VRQAFRRLATEHHPDRFPGASSEELALLVRRFSRISAAYHRLGR
jgi:curved DNA-binding protein CbpA